MVLDGIAGVYFWMKDGFPHLIAVTKSAFWFYGMFAESLKLRSKHQIKDYYQSKWLILSIFIIAGVMLDDGCWVEDYFIFKLFLEF